MPYFFDAGGGRPNVREQKNELRAKFREKRKALPTELKAQWDTQICRRLLSMVSVRYAEEILSFSPLGGEVDVREFNLHIMQSEKKLYLPRCKEGTREMSFHLVSGENELQSGSFSIMEPSADAPVWQNTSSHSVCIIPAMSYDRKGSRLGYGKGYYDRYLSDKSTLKIGVCYSEFISENIPRGRFDLSVDLIVTEKGIITVSV